VIVHRTHDDSRSEPAPPWRALPIERLVFCALWATGPDTTLDAIVRIQAIRAGATPGTLDVLDRFCNPIDAETSEASLAARIEREFGVSCGELAHEPHASDVWRELEQFADGRCVFVLECESFEAWRAHFTGAERKTGATLGLAELASLLFPGRLGQKRETLLAALTQRKASSRASDFGPVDLANALHELVRRFLQSPEDVLRVGVSGYVRAWHGLGAIAPDASRRLLHALAIVDRPSAWALAAGASRGLEDGRLTACFENELPIEDLLEALPPRCARENERWANVENLPPDRDEPMPFDAADRALLDEVFRTVLPALFAAEHGAPSYREGQHSVSNAVADALGSRELLLVHAPTGTGKTLAYLVPAMLWAKRYDVRIGIATYTRALQEQAMDREVPRALAALARVGCASGVRVSVLKGRDNYLCWRALKLCVPDDGDSPESWLAWTALALFGASDVDGDLDRMPLASALPLDDAGAFTSSMIALMRQARAQTACCTHRDDRETCAAEIARRRAEKSHVVISNQAFVLARQEFFKHIVFDECEHLHDQAHNAWSHSLGLRSIRRMLSRLHQPGQRGRHRAVLDRLIGLVLEGTPSHDSIASAIEAARAMAVDVDRLEREVECFLAWRDERARGRSERDDHSLLREFVEIANRDDAADDEPATVRREVAGDERSLAAHDFDRDEQPVARHDIDVDEQSAALRDVDFDEQPVGRDAIGDDEQPIARRRGVDRDEQPAERRVVRDDEPLVARRDGSGGRRPLIRYDADSGEDVAARAADLVESRRSLAQHGNELDSRLAELAERLDTLPLRGIPRLRRSLDLVRQDLIEMLSAIEAWIPLDEGRPAFRPRTFYDVERDVRGDIALASRVLLPNEFLGRNYHPSLSTGVFLSATTWLQESFEPARAYLGLDRAAEPAADESRPACVVRTFRAPDVFDYSRVLVAVPRDAPSIAEGKDAFLDYVRRFVAHLGERTRGRMLVLFTNAQDTVRVGEELAGFFRARRIPLWFQNMAGTAKEEISELFRSRVDSVLLGVDTFWYGADFPGETLEYLVIVKLPYGVPDRYHHAQCAALGTGEQRRRIYLPRALAKFRQGFGRLMRRESDRGCVFILDGRVLDPRHRFFLKELPIERPFDQVDVRRSRSSQRIDASGERPLARLIRADTDLCVREALAHMDLTDDVARRGLDWSFESRARDRNASDASARSKTSASKRADSSGGESKRRSSNRGELAFDIDADAQRELPPLQSSARERCDAPPESAERESRDESLQSDREPREAPLRSVDRERRDATLRSQREPRDTRLDIPLEDLPF
jgi:Rad3-related DNA helicase